VHLPGWRRRDRIECSDPDERLYEPVVRKEGNAAAREEPAIDERSSDEGRPAESSQQVKDIPSKFRMGARSTKG
jgi:hypothetical protein